MIRQEVCPLIGLCCIIMMTLAGCVGKNERTAAASGESALKAPSDLAVVIGRTGEFAGRQSGFRFGEGTVTRWEGKFPGENVLAEAEITEAEMDSLWQLLGSVDFFGSSVQEMGEQTRFMEARTGEQSRRMEWAVQLGGASAHADFDALYESCRVLAISVLER